MWDCATTKEIVSNPSLAFKPEGTAPSFDPTGFPPFLFFLRFPKFFFSLARTLTSTAIRSISSSSQADSFFI